MTEKIARRGYHIYREYGVDPLERHHVDEVMTREVKTIDADMSVREALATYFGATQTHRAYPVVRDGALIGMVDRAVLATIATASARMRSTRVADVLRHRVARCRIAGRNLPARRDAAGRARTRTAAGGRGQRDAAAGRHRVAQRSGQAVARPLRRRARARALPALADSTRQAALSPGSVKLAETDNRFSMPLPEGTLLPFPPLLHFPLIDTIPWTISLPRCESMSRS